MPPPIALFDLDDTLIDRAAAFRRWARWFAEQHGLGHDAVEELCRADGHGYTPRHEMFTAVAQQFGLDEPVDSLVGAYRDRYLTFFEEEPEVQAALARLRETGWRIGVVTNGPAMQLDKVTRSGLEPLVDAVCVSELVGSWKPDPAIFTEALRRLGHDPAAPGPVWMVGDSATNDIGGAHALGFRTIWVRRRGPWSDERFSPEHTVADVPGAVAVLAAERPGRG